MMSINSKTSHWGLFFKNLICFAYKLDFDYVRHPSEYDGIPSDLSTAYLF